MPGDHSGDQGAVKGQTERTFPEAKETVFDLMECCGRLWGGGFLCLLRDHLRLPDGALLNLT